MSFVPGINGPPGILIRRGRGLRHRPEKYHRLGAPHPAKLTGAAAAFAAASSLARFKTYVLNQGRSESCPGGGTSPLVYVSLAAAGTPLSFIPSPRGIYADVRALENPGTGPLADDGADPADLIQALSLSGVRAMTPATTPDGRTYDLWTPDDIAGNPNAPPANVSLRPTAAEDEAGQADLIVGATLIDPTEDDFGDQICSAIDVAKAPVGIGIHATPAFEQYGDAWTASEAPLSDTSGVADGDGHWIGCYGYRTLPAGTRVFWLGNSWGAWGGPQGGVEVTESWLRNMTMVSLKFRCALKAAA